MKISSAHPLALPLALLVAMTVLCTATPHPRQGVDPNGRPISDIQIKGLLQVPEQLVRNQLRAQKGDPYDARVVKEDIVRITHLGRFGDVRAEVQPQSDGSVILTYAVKEQALLSAVQVTGNKAIKDQDLLNLVVLKAGDPADPFLIDRGSQEIKREYEKRGFFVTDVSVDQQLLSTSGILIYRVREGPKVRISELKIEGNHVFGDKELKSKIKSETYFPIFRTGQLSREQLDQDVAAIREYYQDNGYLDTQVGRRIDVAPDQKDAAVIFFIDEGKHYTVDQIKVVGNKAFGTAQVLEAISLKVGDVFSADRSHKSRDAVINLYGRLGYLDTKVLVEKPLFHANEPRVDVLIQIEEGRPAKVGVVTIQGNTTTKDQVVLRQLRGMTPGQRYDATGLEQTRERLKVLPFFADGKVTVLGQAGDEFRDAVIEVKEKNTGNLSFGGAVSSDAGVIGAIDLTQRNFDIADVPESFGELLSGRAFRGAGQYFKLAIEPGTEFSRYEVTFREPYLLNSNLFLDTSGYFWTRQREEYDEGRTGGTVGVGQAFGDVWSAHVAIRAEEIKIDSIQKHAPNDVFDVEGSNALTALMFGITRNTTNSPLFPTTGSNSVLTLSQVGALGGSYSFTQIVGEFTKFWTIDEDFLGRKTVLSSRLQAGYISGNAPTFERFYAGGQRTMRGFDFRGIGPRGIDHFTGKLGSDPIGGNWIFLWNLEYNFPVYEDIVRVVFFVDTGTVQEDFGFDQYRVSVGSGLRLKIPFLGQAPIAFDFAIPVIKQHGDQTRFFSFDIAVPF